MLQRVCVFAGSNTGSSPRYAESAAELGRRLAAEGLGVVYGGGNVGLMGVLADACLADGGEVIGVIPGFLRAKELAHLGVTRLEEVGSMHERKARMTELADGFVALPGGFGTFEELFEVVTWAQLGLHRKPVVLFDVDGFYEPLFALAERSVAAGFVRPEHAALAVRAPDVDAVLAALHSPPPPPAEKWLDRAAQT